MRYLSSIIKSGRVSMGDTIVSVESDLPKVIKKSKPLEEKKEVNENVKKENIRQEKVMPKPEELITEKEKQEILAKYMEEEKEKVLAKCIEEARKKSELFFEEEMKKAYDEGVKKAEQDVQAFMQEAEIKANEIILEATEIKQKAIDEYKASCANLEPEVIALSLDIAQKILNKEIKDAGDYILNIVKDAMDKISSKKDITLKVSEKDYTVIIGNMDIMLAKVQGFGDVNVIKDLSLDDGSCIVETEYGIIDGSLKTRVEQVKKEIEKMLNR